MSDQPTITKGYKVFLPNFTAKEKGFQYAENSEFHHNEPIKICNSGFHFCLKVSDCFSYYDFTPENIVCEVEGVGEFQTHSEDSKVCVAHLRVGRKLSWAEVLFLANEGANNTGHSNSGDSNSGNWNSGDSNSGYSNSGYWNSGNSNSGNRNSGDSNSGYWNSGDSNSGYRNSGNSNSGDSNSGNRNSGYSNSGYWNSGDSNSGDRNSGNWNSGDSNSGDSNSGYRNSGAFCIDENPKVWLFDQPTDIPVRDWEGSKPYQIMANHLEFTIFVPMSIMTDDEKAQHPKYETIKGYLKSIPHKEAWSNMWHKLDDHSKAEFTNLQNFDAAKFEHITGIDVTKK